jgi:hypothetical protein
MNKLTNNKMYINGPIIGMLIGFTLSLTQLTQCAITKCDIIIDINTIYNKPINCRERACLNELLKKNHTSPSLSTISETAINGNLIGGNYIFGSTMSILSLFFIFYITQLHNILYNIITNDTNYHKLKLKLKMSRWAGCISSGFLGLLAIISLDTSIYIHCVGAFMFFLSIIIYIFLINYILNILYIPFINKTNDTFAVNIHYLSTILSLKKCTLYSLLITQLSIGLLGYIVYTIKGPNQYVIQSNIQAITQWISVICVGIWIGSLQFEIKYLKLLFNGNCIFHRPITSL